MVQVQGYLTRSKRVSVALDASKSSTPQSGDIRTHFGIFLCHSWYVSLRCCRDNECLLPMFDAFGACVSTSQRRSQLSFEKCRDKDEQYYAYISIVVTSAILWIMFIPFMLSS